MIRRTCTGCGRTVVIVFRVDSCPDCGQELGRPEIGEARIPDPIAPAWQPLPEPLPLLDGQEEMFR